MTSHSGGRERHAAFFSTLTTGSFAILFGALSISPARAAGDDHRTTDDTVASDRVEMTIGEGPTGDATIPPLAIWRRWRDPALRVLLEEAHRRSPTLAQAEARLREARAQFRQASAERKPTVDLAAGAQRSRLNDRDHLLDPAGERYDSQWDLSLNWRWNLDLFGAGAAQRDAARWRADAEAVALEAARSELSAEVARQYVLVRAGDTQQRSERSLLALLREQAAIDAALAEAGLLAAPEGFALRAERENREAALRDGEVGRRRALLALRALGAGEVDAIERLLAVRTSSPNDSSAPNASTPISHRSMPDCRAPMPQRWPVSMLARRFDVRIAEYGERAASADAQAARRARWPSLSLSGRGGWVGSDPGDLVRPSNLGAQLLAGLGLSLFDFGRLKSQSQAANARREAAQADLARTVLRAAEEVDVALLTIDRSHHAAVRTGRAREEGDAAAAVAQARWHAGLDSRRQAIATERDALERVIAESIAEQQLCEAHIALSLALALPERALAQP